MYSIFKIYKKKTQVYPDTWESDDVVRYDDFDPIIL